MSLKVSFASAISPSFLWMNMLEGTRFTSMKPQLQKRQFQIELNSFILLKILTDPGEEIHERKIPFHLFSMKRSVKILKTITIEKNLAITHYV